MIIRLLLSKFFIGTVIFSAALFLFVAIPQTSAQQVSPAQVSQFFIDPSFDTFKRTQLSATLYYEGNKAQYFVENAYLDTLGGHSRAQLSAQMDELSKIFDTQIYHALTRTFGLEWIPGIDGNAKITVLFVQMPKEFGGYFTDYNEFSRARFATSNEREMVYLNVNQLKIPSLAASFLAHEFQHLINFNQKTRQGIVDEIWFNEMMSEVAPTVAGLNDIYEGSTLKLRVERLLQKPSDTLTTWDAKSEDYASVNLFGHYLFGQYGKEFFTLLSQSKKTGIDAINEALAVIKRPERFEDIFTNWVIANLLNDCQFLPIKTFCYNNPNLTYDNLHLNFNVGTGAGDVVSSTDSAMPWQGQWFQYERTLSDIRPANHIFTLEFSTSPDTRFGVLYVVFKADKAELFRFPLDQSQSGTAVVEDFGFNVKKVVLVPINQTLNSSTSAVFRTTARLLEQAPVSQQPAAPYTMGEPVMSINNPLPNIADGALIRALGDTKVYIVKGLHKRWIQSPQVIDFYGHLRWEDIIEVSSEVLSSYRDSNVIRFANDPHVYKITVDNRKIWVKTEQEFLSAGYIFNMVYEINEKEFLYYR